MYLVHTHMIGFGNVMISITWQIREEGRPQAWELGHYTSDCQKEPCPVLVLSQFPGMTWNLGWSRDPSKQVFWPRMLWMMRSGAWMQAVPCQLATVPAGSPEVVQLTISSFIEQQGPWIKKYEHAVMSTRFWHLLSSHTTEDDELTLG